MIDVQQITVRDNDCFRELIKCIDRGEQGIALLVDADQRFVATVTDGDVRRAILSGAQLDSLVSIAIEDENGQRRKSTTAPVDTSREEQLRIMREREVRHLPLLDEHDIVRELATIDEIVEWDSSHVQAVIMAGGFGKRLRPLTDNLPKPMLRVGGRPLMERTIQSLEQAGIKRINITTHFMPEKITNYFGSGSRHGVELKYVSEEQPLGTAGALRLLEDSEDPLLVMNGDILTRVDFRALMSFHRKQQAALTVGARQYEVDLPYGVIEARDGIIHRLREKPKYGFLVNAGVYVVEPSVRRSIPFGRKYDMTDLIDQLLSDGQVVTCFPIVEYWLDIGRHEDFQKAEQDMRELRWAA